ncbi:MAG: glycosyltransferase family 4 protein [Ferruginibacter sp.]
MKKLAIITTHPIQYNAPLFKLLHERKNIEIKVFYTWSQAATGIKYDPGFNKDVQWDIPLLEGYPFVFSENISASPGSHHYKGIDNPGLVKEISGWNADAVLIYGWNLKSHLRAMRFFYKRKPVIFRGDSTLLDEQPGLKKILRRIYLRYIFSSVNTALFAGKANKEYFLAHGLRENQLVFMPHAVDNQRFVNKHETIEKGAALRAQLNIPDHATVFLFAGKLEPKKQPGMLTEVFTQLDAQNAYLVIAGSGQLEDRLRKLYAGKPNIRFIGFQNQQDIPSVYAAADVFVLPSRGPGETWGLSINEAMAAGKAIIASDACGAVYDLITVGVNGFVFNRNDKKALQRSLMYFLENREAGVSMGNASAEKIKEYDYIHDCMAIESTVNES